MLRGIYSAAAGMTSQMMLTDMTADNLANVSTPGYKMSAIQFKTFGEALINRMGNNQPQLLGRFAQGNQVLHSVINFNQGDLQQTGNPLDLGIQGNGFFKVKLPYKNDAIAYTRAGEFTRDENGFITTHDGARLQGQNGDILIPRKASKIEISQYGEVVVDGKTIERIPLISFGDNNALKRIGNSMYTVGPEVNEEVAQAHIEQGFLESSNANVITELVNSMTGLRIYETLQKSIQMQNQTLEKAVNDVGRV